MEGNNEERVQKKRKQQINKYVKEIMLEEQKKD